MGTEQDKAVMELAVFREFISKAGVSVDAESVRKPGTESEPDIFCTLSSGERVAYELVEICSPDIAAHISRIGSGDDVAFHSSDPTVETLRKKLRKTYKTTLPIELICYTNGRTISPDDLIVIEAQRWANAIDGPFRKVWLLGEGGVYEVWTGA